MKHQAVIAVMALIALTSCIPATRRGSVTMRVSDREAHVSLGAGEVKAGDRVALRKQQCSRLTSTSNPRLVIDGSVPPGCRLVKVGEGLVTRTLSDHYSVVEVDEGVTYEEGAFVEKL